MDIVNIVIMLLIGVFGGFISGLVGVGGAIIIYPAILLLPPLFGAPAYSAYIASGLTSSQVFFKSEWIMENAATNHDAINAIFFCKFKSCFSIGNMGVGQK
ncbi:hypothetical protein APW31_12800 [Staphylococcus aureus]|nr:hypothetical protein APW31_12800 [Staphylococcus aureus]